MFLSKKSAISTLALSLLIIAPITAKKPETFLGKIGASILQTVDTHSFLTGIALSRVNNELLQFKTPKDFKGFIYQVITVAPITLVEMTLIKALTKNFEVDPIQ